ncbi:hypothetical protein [Halorussus amylolyticus]|uniref:hypothetical protein n=1 Tax=Halorussus amylolyticus TaxID=1126242 RepID=UPI0010476ADF|nr:hypothetical protein [Halorussus amylolyticus]
MGRWGELATRFRGTDAKAGPPSLEEFIESNHQLFTIIGMFGALSVYLIEFQQSAGVSRGSVGAVLVLFLLTSALAVRNSYLCTERARDHGEYLLVFGFAVFMYAFVTLAVSVTLVIASRYAEGAENVIGSSLIYALVFIYIPFVFRADIFTEFDGSAHAAAAIRYAPHLGAGVLSSWYAVKWRLGALPDVEFGSAAYGIGFVLSLLGNHLAVTGVVFGAVWTADRVARVVRRMR